MGIKAVLENIDGLEDSLASLYVKNDETGKYTLDVEGGIPDVENLKKSLVKERDSAKELARKMKEYEGIDPIKARDALNKIATGNDLASDSEARQKALEEALNKSNGERDALVTKLNNASINAALQGSDFLNKVSKDPVHRIFAVDSVRNNFKVIEDKIVGFDDDGKEIYNNECNIASVAEAHERIIMSRSYAQSILAGSNANGSGATTINTRTNNMANPWAKETRNSTEQHKLMSNNPTLANQLMQQAGITT